MTRPIAKFTFLKHVHFKMRDMQSDHILETHREWA